MRSEKESAIDLRESSRRIAVWIVVIACHLGCLISFLQPAIDDPEASLLAKDEAPALQLRFLSLPRLSPVPVVARTAQVSGSPRPRFPAPTQRIAVSTVHTAIDIPSQTAATPANAVQPIQAQAANEADATNDGGFAQRLRDAQHGADVKGVPGSDKALVPGMHFVDPMDHGIGAVARQAQRLFGIKSRQCLDVEKWRSMTPQELSARHIAPDDVDRQDARYACNAPPGLHF